MWWVRLKSKELRGSNVHIVVTFSVEGKNPRNGYCHFKVEYAEGGDYETHVQDTRQISQCRLELTFPKLEGQHVYFVYFRPYFSSGTERMVIVDLRPSASRKKKRR